MKKTYLARRSSKILESLNSKIREIIRIRGGDSEDDYREDAGKKYAVIQKLASGEIDSITCEHQIHLVRKTSEGKIERKHALEITTAVSRTKNTTTDTEILTKFEEGEYAEETLISGGSWDIHDKINIIDLSSPNSIYKNSDLNCIGHVNAQLLDMHSSSTRVDLNDKWMSFLSLLYYGLLDLDKMDSYKTIDGNIRYLISSNVTEKLYNHIVDTTKLGVSWRERGYNRSRNIYLYTKRRDILTFINYNG